MGCKEVGKERERDGVVVVCECRWGGGGKGRLRRRQEMVEREHKKIFRFLPVAMRLVALGVSTQGGMRLQSGYLGKR